MNKLFLKYYITNNVCQRVFYNLLYYVISFFFTLNQGSFLTRNVVWVHNGIPIYHVPKNKNDDPGPISVTTEVIQPENTIQSRLFIRGASPSALGNYTCTAPNTEPDTVNVYVSEGKFLLY